MEKLFNIIFVGALASLFISRLFYGIFQTPGIFSNLLVFLLIPYFPGLSLLGAVVGASSYLFFLKTRKEDLPVWRISDFFSVAFLISLPIGFLGYFVSSEKGIPILNLAIQAGLYFILFIVFIKFFLPRLLNGKFREGLISLLFLQSFSLVSLISNAFPAFDMLSYVKNIENIILIFIFFVSLSFFVYLRRVK